MTGVPIAVLRRWGMGWRNIIKCVLGLHGRLFYEDGFRKCSRCGRVL